MWTKEETNQLFDLCERFDLRFIVIADRFPSSRSVEELKSRYYAGSLQCYLAQFSFILDFIFDNLVFFGPYLERRNLNMGILFVICVCLQFVKHF